MAAAIAKLWPDSQFAAGPAVEEGFYYDGKDRKVFDAEEWLASMCTCPKPGGAGGAVPGFGITIRLFISNRNSHFL